MTVQKPEIQYVHQFYVYGSEAPALKPEAKPRHPKFAMPKPKRAESIKVFVDPVALCGVVIAVLMAVVLAVGVVQFNEQRQELYAMSGYLNTLKHDNLKLQQEYREGYDLTTIEDTARAIGLVTIDQLETISVKVTVPEPEKEPTIWENFVMDIKELFA